MYIPAFLQSRDISYTQEAVGKDERFLRTTFALSHAILSRATDKLGTTHSLVLALDGLNERKRLDLLDEHCQKFNWRTYRALYGEHQRGVLDSGVHWVSVEGNRISFVADANSQENLFYTAERIERAVGGFTLGFITSHQVPVLPEQHATMGR